MELVGPEVVGAGVLTPVVSVVAARMIGNRVEVSLAGLRVAPEEELFCPTALARSPLENSSERQSLDAALANLLASQMRQKDDCFASFSRSSFHCLADGSFAGSCVTGCLPGSSIIFVRLVSS